MFSFEIKKYDERHQELSEDERRLIIMTARKRIAERTIRLGLTQIPPREHETPSRLQAEAQTRAYIDALMDDTVKVDPLSEIGKQNLINQATLMANAAPIASGYCRAQDG